MNFPGTTEWYRNETTIYNNNFNEMKIRNFLLLGIAALVFFWACSKDNNPKTGSTEDKAYVAFSIALPSGQGTKADVSNIGDADHKDSYVGTANEQAINKIRVALYSINGAVKYAFDLKATTNGTGAIAGDDVSGTTATVSNFISKGREIEVADYSIGVFINPTTAILEATAEGSGTMTKTKLAEETTPAALTSGGVLMSNADGFKKVLKANFSGNSDAAKAEASPIFINVDRAVAKIFVGINAGTNLVCNVPGAKLGADIAWVPNVTNKKMFWIREVANVVGDVTLETEATTRYNRYAKDPNYVKEIKDLSAANLRKEFNYATNADGANFVGIGYSDANGIYVLENTMEAEGQYTQVTTTAIVRLNFAPKDISLGESWFRYNGMALSVTEFKALLKQAVEEAVLGNNAEITGVPVGFKGHLVGLYQDLAGLSGFVGTEIYSETFINNKIALGAFDIKWTGGSYLYYFHQGINYYDILIRHFDNSQEPKNMAYGRYGVVRNNIYKLNLESVLGPGRPMIVPTPEPGPDPGPGPTPGPDDKTTAYISAKLTVLPWFVRTQSVNLQ